MESVNILGKECGNLQGGGSSEAKDKEIVKPRSATACREFTLRCVKNLALEVRLNTDRM